MKDFRLLILVFTTLCVPFATCSQQVDKAHLLEDYEMLRGVKAMSVSVDQTGSVLPQSLIESDLKQSLRRMGMQVLPTTDPRTYPCLTISLMALTERDNAGNVQGIAADWSLQVALAVPQRVGAETKYAKATVWQMQGIVDGGLLSTGPQIRSGYNTALKELEKDYHKGNR